MHHRQNGHLHPNAYTRKTKLTQFCPRCYVITMVLDGLIPNLDCGSTEPSSGTNETLGVTSEITLPLKCVLFRCICRIAF